MRTITRFALCALILLACSAQALAQAPPAVKRYIDQATVAVGRIDLSRFDAPAFELYVDTLAADLPAGQRDELMTGLRQAMGQFQQAIGPLREAGVTRAWFVLEPSTLLQGNPPLLVIPVENDQQATLVTDLLSATEEEHQRVEGAILVGSQHAIQAASAITPSERPAFDANLPENGPAVQVVLEPTPTIRAATEASLVQLSQRLPQVPAAGGNLARTLQLMTLSLALPPEPQGRAVFTFADAGSATQAADLLRQAVTAARDAAADPATPDGLAQQLAAALEPEVQGSTVVLSLDDAEIRNSLAKPLMLAMLQAREQAQMVRSGSNMRMIGGGLRITMQNDQEGRYPADFSGLRGMVQVHGAGSDEEREQALIELFTNPRTGASPGYQYVRPIAREKDLKQDQWRTLVMLYEKPPADAAADYMVNVLFPDGHVESMPLSRLEELAQQQGFQIERLP